MKQNDKGERSSPSPPSVEEETSVKPAPVAEATEPTQTTMTTMTTMIPHPEASVASLHQDDECLAEVGFMFEGSLPTKVKRFEWILGSTTPDDVDGSDSLPQPRTVRVLLNVIDDEPGAVQSGHYLWPGATLLADYLVHQYNNHRQQKQHNNMTVVESVVELGAGCALAALTALQVWQPVLQYMVVTDHDPGVLARARDNYESTLEHLFDASNSDIELNEAIKNVGSIPVVFENLEWGGGNATLEKIRQELQQHTNSEEDTFDLLLGTDLIYCEQVVEPLLETVHTLMKKPHGRFLLSQSFAFDPDTEDTFDNVCQRLGLLRIIRQQNEDGTERIQEFRFQSSSDEATVEVSTQNVQQVDTPTKEEPEANR